MSDNNTTNKNNDINLHFIEAKHEYELKRLEIKYQAQLELDKRLELEKYNVKSVQDLEKQKKYYEEELEHQRKFYEKEIEKRQGETADFFNQKSYEEKNALKEEYEKQLADKQTEITLLEKKQELLIKSRVKVNRKKEYNPIKVSVILPIYNVGKYLKQSLDSIINQTMKEIEIICINDGSTDNCKEILERYRKKDSRIVVVHKHNEGTGIARNVGLKLAKGDCIAFVDPDDYIKKDMFEKLYSLIEARHLDISMCMPDGYDEKNKRNRPFPYFVDDNFKNIIDDREFNWHDLSPFSYPMCVWNKMYKRKFLNDNHIDFAEGLDFEDHKVIFGALLHAKRIFFIREKLYVYRFNRKGSILTDNNRRLLDHIEIYNIVEKLLEETNSQKDLRNDFLFYKIHNLLYYYSMIKPEFKEEYFKEMVKSVKATNLTEEETEMLLEKYPDLQEVLDS